MNKNEMTLKILVFPDFRKDFIVSTDTSNFVVGCLLKQLSDNRYERVFQYVSKALNYAQKSYAVIEKRGTSRLWRIRTMNGSG